ncbi:hypothetical protein ACFXKC_56635, partial [Streptomyces sp. NPDC059340]
MTDSEADLLALVRELDDPQWLEWPQSYDRGEIAVHFGGLGTMLLRYGLAGWGLVMRTAWGPVRVGCGQERCS